MPKSITFFFLIHPLPLFISSSVWQQDKPREGGRNRNESRSVVSDSWWPRGLYSPWNSPGQNTGVCSLSLLLGVFPTLGSNPGLPHCRWILHQLSHKGSPRILERVAYLFSSRSSDPGIELGSPACRQILYQLSHQGSPEVEVGLNQQIFMCWAPESLFAGDSGQVTAASILALMPKWDTSWCPGNGKSLGV